jgi:hypothetical protein
LRWIKGRHAPHATQSLLDKGRMAELQPLRLPKREPGGGLPAKSKDQSHALGYAPGTEVPSHIEAEREALPVTGGQR